MHGLHGMYTRSSPIFQNRKHVSLEYQLRIDNSRHSAICTFGLTSRTMSCTLTYFMSKNGAHFSLSDDVNDVFVRFGFIQILV